MARRVQDIFLSSYTYLQRSWIIRNRQHRNEQGDNEKQATCENEVVQTATNNDHSSGLPGHPGNYKEKGISNSI